MGKGFLRTWVRRVTGGLLVLTAMLYLGAKAHFFARFDPNNLSGYVAEHSFFWAAGAVVAALLWLVTFLGEKDGTTR